jgi:dimethylhistidine N-methyltransferase
MRRQTGTFTHSSEADSRAAAQFAAHIQYYLTQSPRQLPSRYLYDPLGSALFEAICRLPWYRITRAEERLIAQHGAEVLLRHSMPVSKIVELGSGSGQKLSLLLEQRGPGFQPLQVHVVDLSAAALDATSQALASAPGVRVTTHLASYEDGLKAIREDRRNGGRSLVLFLGSNIGNYDRPGASALVHGIRHQLAAGDGLLLGTDLVKPERELLLAYDDPLGVTAAFNLNLLERINRELGGDFDLRAFAHEAVWNAAESRVEMHLVARSRQQIHVDAAQLTFTMQAGERIWTESSYKYRPDDIRRLVEPAGFRVAAQWIDEEDRFALTLAQAVEP